MIKKQILIISLLAITITISGCVSVPTKKKNNNSAIDGGIFKSIDKGRTWKQKTLIPTVSGKPKNFSAVSMASLTFDPSDYEALYYGTIGNGLLFTYDGGENWQQVKSLGNSTIRNIAIDPNSKCIIYTAIGNKVYKSTDCSRTWKQIYIDNEKIATVDNILVNHYDSSIIYITISRGDFIISYDGGKNWKTLYRFNNKINKIIMDENDSRLIYALTSKKGVFRSQNGGKSWEDFNNILEELKLPLIVKDIILIKKEPKTIYLILNNIMLKSLDNGETWKKIELIPPEKKISIHAVAINPDNTKEIYYTTNTTFNISQDGGETWAPTKLPTTRSGKKLMINPENTNIIYMGIKAYPKKK